MKEGNDKSLSADKFGIIAIAVIAMVILLCSLFFYYVDLKNNIPYEMTAVWILLLQVVGAIAIYTVYWESKNDESSQSKVYLEKAERRAKAGSAAIDIIMWGSFAAMVYSFLFT